MTIIYVDYVNGSDITGSGTDVSPYQTFGPAYNLANNGDVIDLSGDFSWTDSSIYTGYTIDKNITIQGQPGTLTKIDCGSDRRAFTMGNSTLTVSFSNLDIYNGLSDNPSNRKSPIIALDTMTGGNVYMSNCWFHDCSSGHEVDTGYTGRYSLFYVEDTNLQLHNVTVNNCYSNYVVLFSAGTCDVTLTNCTFTNLSYGGTDMIYVLSSTLTMYNNTIYNNTTRNNKNIFNVASSTIVTCKNNILYHDRFLVGSGIIDTASHNLSRTTATNVTDGVNGNIIATTASFGTIALNNALTGVPTLALLDGNPAIGAGDIDPIIGIDVPIPLLDARGYTRTTADMGAYWYGDITPEITVSGESNYMLFINTEINTIAFNSNSSVTWSVTPSLPTGLTLSTELGTITGTPTTYSIIPTEYTVYGTDSSDRIGSTTINLSVIDQYVMDLSSNTGYTSENLNSIHNITIPESDALDISGYVIDASRTRRRHLINMIMSRSQNTSKTFFKTGRSSLKLPDIYTKDTIRVYRKNVTIDLNDLTGDEGAYCAINDNGDQCTFLNVGGNNNTVQFIANGNATYNMILNGEDIGTAVDDEEIVISGVAFYIGSVGTEGTAGDEICFTGDARVMTDIGPVPIKDVCKGMSILSPFGQLHTVQEHVRIVNLSPYLIEIQKDMLAPQCPDQNTIITPEHQIWYHDRWIKASDISGATHVNAVPYQYVYNLLLISVSGCDNVMLVNNMAVESLNQRNVNAMTRKCGVVRIEQD